MSKPGRKSLPSKIMRLHGNPSGRPMNDAEPEPDPGEPPMPERLGELGREKWRELVPLLLGMGVLTVADGGALAELCFAWQIRHEAQGKIDELGLLITEQRRDGERVKPNPAVAIARSWSDVVTRYEVQFGLTPSARTGVKTTKPADPQERTFVRLKRDA